MTDLDPEEFRVAAHRLVDWIADHRAGLRQLPVNPSVTPGQVRRVVDHPFADTPHDDPAGALMSLLDDVVVPGSLLWQHPGFYGYFPAQASLASLLGDMASGALGSQGMLWSTSPAGTELEQVILDRLAGALGLPESFTFAGGGGGSMQDSASSASLVALVTALGRRRPEWVTAGLLGTERVYATDQTHSSMVKATRVAGLGDQAVVVVDVEPGSQAMSAAHLAQCLDADAEAGLDPVLVCATLGTTGTGAFDPLAPLTAAAALHRTWVHVDAAWAGVAALCPEHRWMLDGVAAADSFCTDGHKWLGVAFDASFLWVRDGTAPAAALSITPEYLRDAASEAGGIVDFRDWQVPLGRRMRALKVWMVLATQGLEGLRTGLREHVAWAEWLAEQVEATPGVELTAPRSLSLVCLHVVDGSGAPDNDATRSLLTAVNATGRHFCTHTVVGGTYTIRVAIGSLGTTRGDVEQLWKALAAALG